MEIAELVVPQFSRAEMWPPQAKTGFGILALKVTEHCSVQSPV